MNKYGFLLSEFNYLHLDNICNDVEQSLKKQEEVYLFLGKPLKSPDKRYRNENVIYNLAKSSEIKGIISFNGTLGPFGGNELLKQYLSSFNNSNIILIDDEINGMSSIMLDNYNSSQSIINHLFEHGLRRFAYINGPKDNRDAIERVNGIIDYLKAKKIELEDVFDGDYSFESGEKVVKYYMETGKELPEAFVCVNDETAIGVYNTLKTYGIKVPRDVLLVGFDNTEPARHLECPLTTIDQSYSKMVIEGLDVLRNNSFMNITLPGELIIRESCGCLLPIKKAEEEYVEKKIFMDKYQRLLNDHIENLKLQSEFSMIDTREKLLENLKSILVNYNDFELHICLYEENLIQVEDPLNFAFPSYMNCFLSFVNGEFYTNTHFKTDLILPDFVKEKSNTRVYLVYPLRNNDISFGYIVCNTKTANDYKFVSLKDSMNITLNRIEMQRKLNYYQLELEALSYKDYLTGLLNRRGLYYYAETMFKDNVVNGLSPAVIYCDIDHLKKINDIFGHNTGDYIIQEASKLLQEFFPNEIVARVGGDEFIVFIANYSLYDDMNTISKLKILTEKKNEEIQKPFTFGVSFGLSIYDHSLHSRLDDVIEDADNKLYELRKTTRLNS